MLNRIQGYFAVVLVLAAVAAVGCQQSATQRLVGQWEGSPAPTRPGGGVQEAPSPAAEATEATEAPATTSAAVTDLESFDIRITLDLDEDGRVRMWREDRRDELTGTWKVLDTLGPTNRLQITANAAPEASSAPGERDQLRHFQIEWDESGESFTLVEEGADPQFGFLTFRRLTNANSP